MHATRSIMLEEASDTGMPGCPPALCWVPCGSPAGGKTPKKRKKNTKKHEGEVNNRYTQNSLHDVAHGRELVERPDQVHGAVEDELLEHDPSPLQVEFLFKSKMG